MRILVLSEEEYKALIEHFESKEGYQGANPSSQGAVWLGAIPIQIRGLRKRTIREVNKLGIRYG